MDAFKLVNSDRALQNVARTGQTRRKSQIFYKDALMCLTEL